MQVRNVRNFIFDTGQIKFGSLYKSAQSRKDFLNTFTPCILQETALQFL